MNIQNIKERWQAEETAAGNFLKNWVGKLLILIAALGQAAEYLLTLPSDWIPQWVKTAVLVAGIIGFVSGKLTKK